MYIFSSHLIAPCQDPGYPNKGNRIGDDFRHGKKVTFTCSRDYRMEGVQTVTCSEGRWSNRKPSCKGKFYMLSKRVVVVGVSFAQQKWKLPLIYEQIIYD